MQHGPHFAKVDTEIVMNQDMPHGDDLSPRDVRVSLAKCGGQFTGCLTDDLDVMNHSGMNEFVFFERAATSLGIPFDVLDRLQDLLLTVAIIPHKATASLSTSFRTTRRSQRSEATSTGRFSSRSKSRTNAAWSSKLRPSSMSTRKSMSLPRRAVPRATDPNIRTFRAPCRAAILRIWLRLDWSN
jgi:hypothetical protein